LTLLLLGACSGSDAPRAVIEEIRPLQRGALLQLEVQQRLDFQPNMLDALSNGIGLRLDYRIDYCRPAQRTLRSLWLRYYPLANEFEMRWEGEPHGRRFARRGALLAALDQVRIELPDAAAGCELALRVQLERSALPAPLRFPALIGLQDWRLASAPFRMPERSAP
jgi:hypothetical protein